ncbi:hypothetical protein PENSPDRAFT_421648 [Peniophora sp. CONT]|nr:hypothetical protein PENSPDRAFT_421648 [Peniophora sp. CONT]
MDLTSCIPSDSLWLKSSFFGRTRTRSLLPYQPNLLLVLLLCCLHGAYVRSRSGRARHGQEVIDRIRSVI